MLQRLWLILVLMVGATAHAEPDAYQLLERMTNAIQDLTYEGIFVYSHDGMMESMKILHRSAQNGESERMITLNGKPREVLRNRDTVTCIFPDTDSILMNRSRIQRSMLSALPKTDSGLSLSYRITIQGKGRVAGMDAQIVEILPRDRYRYGYRIWLHSESGLPLRTILLGSDQEVLEQVIFTSLQVRKSLSDKELEPTLQGRQLSWLTVKDSAKEEVDRFATNIPEWDIMDLPEGFTLRSSRAHQIPGRPMPAQHHLYSDGVASVSVYVEPIVDENVHIGTTRKGAVSAYGRVIDSYQITVIGEVPPETVRMFAQSLRISDGK